ncbi:MAG: hypothetical protein ABIN89_14250 [Chitinophagaceae bacterium]
MFIGAGLAPALTAYETNSIFMGDVDKIPHVSGVTGRGQAPPLQTPRIKIVIYTGDIDTTDRRLTPHTSRLTPHTSHLTPTACYPK